MNESDIIDPTKNFTPRQNPPKPQPTPAEALTIDPTDVKAVRSMVWDKLVRIAAVSPPNAALLPLLREILDRIEGKPVQAVNMHGQLNVVTVNANIEFIQSSRDNLIIDHVDKAKAIDK